jgi:hypothetical protein
MLVFIVISVLIISCKPKPKPEPKIELEPKVQTSELKISTVLQSAQVAEFGKNVLYIEATKDNFGRSLQKWITDNPKEVITAIGYDSYGDNGDGGRDEKYYGSNFPIGYFIIHYPDSLFNPFRIK